MSEEVWTKEYKIERYRRMNETAQKGSVLFAGSSLMEMFPVEQFAAEDRLPVTVYNRGVGGYVTDELLENISVCILDLAPRRLFINIGTNDPLKDEQGRLHAEFTYEGMHINEEGYRAIWPPVKKYILE